MTGQTENTTFETPDPRVLLVDDEPAVLDALRRQLGGTFDITTAEGAEEALLLMATGEPFAVVVSDMKMPGMGGVAFLTIVRERYPETVRLLLTGQMDMQSIVDAINLGQIHQFLSKPCPPSTIEAALHDAVELHRRLSAERGLVKSASAVVQALGERRGTPERPTDTLNVESSLIHTQPPAPSFQTLGERLALIRVGTALGAEPPPLSEG